MANKATKTVFPSSYQLSSEELDMQKRRGQLYKKHVLNSVEDFGKGLKKGDKVGLMLSGGVDSTTLLWAMLQKGIRPYVYTFHLPTTSTLSGDADKAQHLANRYGLPFRVVEFPKDPDWVVNRIFKIWEMDNTLRSRADFEVLCLWSHIVETARDKDGVTTLFSGIADNNIHILSRKVEIKARRGQIGLAEANNRRMFTLDPDQTLSLIRLCHEMYGVNLNLPLHLSSILQPYYNVPWQVMNVPRLKQITIGAWKAEEESSGIQAKVSPMQCADSGSRVYFDEMVSSSSVAETFVGAPLKTAMPLYNAIIRPIAGKYTLENTEFYSWLGHVADGMPLPDDFKRPPIDERTGRAFMPEPEEEEVDLFGLGEDREEYMLDENGKPDTRADCYGNPLYLGPNSSAMTNCPRALAGLCGKYNPDSPYKFHKCEAWDHFSVDAVSFTHRMADISTGRTAEVYHRWADKAEEILSKIQSETYSFS